MEIRTFAGRSRTNGLHRIAAKGIYSEKKQHDAAQQLQIENILINIIEHKAHPITGEQSVCYIAQRGSQTCHKSIPTPFIQSPLDA